MNLFTKPRLSQDFAHYVVRKSIIDSINLYLNEFNGTVVDLGCGNMPYKEIILGQKNVKRYISVDWPGTKYYNNKIDLFWDGITIPLDENSVNCVLFTEVLEHISNPTIVLKEIKRILKPDGIVIGTTPFFWLLHEVPNDIQRLTPFGLDKIIKDAGYSYSTIIGAGGWKRSLAQFICMYVGFGITNKYIKAILKKLFYFPVLYLYKTDKMVKEFKHAGMINSISFKAVK